MKKKPNKEVEALKKQLECCFKIIEHLTETVRLVVEGLEIKEKESCYENLTPTSDDLHGVLETIELSEETIMFRDKWDRYWTIKKD